ncbi:MAG: metallophosphoesterase family protein [Lachnospiraceae bacterium]|nr:metallophosphoesterase family protein [Lachnospiraceae bacterium]
MRLAVISDIHGNLHALNEVLADAQKNNVDEYIFVGDYCLSSPYPNECIQRMRELDGAHVIRGNEEKYLENLIGKDQSTWTDGQMQISYYCYRAVSEENLEYLLSRPHSLELIYGDTTLHIAHASDAFIEDREIKEWLPAYIAKRYQGREITETSIQEDMHAYFDQDEKFQQIFTELNQGIYIFGHSHVQWNYCSEDGKKILLNPGSCGLPLDGITGSFPYTILDISEDAHVSLEERRIPYDVDAYIKVLLESDQFVKANVWTKIIAQELKTGREHLFWFLQFAEKYAGEIGDTRRPFALDTWETAYEIWSKRILRDEGGKTQW